MPSPLPTASRARSSALLGRALSRTFLSLRNRNFRLFFTGQIISNTGNWLTLVALTLLVLKLTGSGLAVGLVTACQFGPILFLSPWAGAVADRTDKRRMLLWTQGLEMVQSAGLAFFAFMPHPPLAGLYALAAFGGVLLSFDNPLRRSFVSEMVPRSDLPNAIVLYSITLSASRALGPALAGLLATTLGYGWCFTIDAASYLAVLIGLARMRPAELQRRPAAPPDRHAVRAGIRYVFSVPVLWVSFVMLAVVGTLAYNFNVAFPLFVTRGLRGTETEFTVLYSIFSVGAVAGALLAAQRGAVRTGHVVVGAAALGAALLALSLAPGIRSALAIAFLAGLASILYMTSTTAIVQTESRRDMHGRVLALQSVLVAGTSLIGGPMTGWLADRLGGRAPLVMGGIACLLAAAFGRAASRAPGGLAPVADP